jgi:hypothetical protein
MHGELSMLLGQLLGRDLWSGLLGKWQFVFERRPVLWRWLL